MGSLRSLSCWCVLGLAIFNLLLDAPPARSQSQPATPKAPAALGTIKSITSNQLVLATDSGSEVKIQLPADVKVLQVPPGSKDLKEATSIQLSDLQAGDRVLVQTKPGEDPSTLVALRVIAMKKSDIAEKQAKDREAWQRQGIGGLVKSVDAANGAITIGTFSASGSKDVLIHVSKDTVLRRYASGSIKFEDAKPAPLTDVHSGDQLRARGSRNADGTEFTANEIVSGSFRNIAGPITAVDGATGTLTVNDIATKKSIELKVTPDSQLRKVPQPVAQRIAMRLKGENGAPGTSPPPASANSGGPPSPPAGQGAPAGGNPGGGPPRGGGDVQQMLSRLPASPLNDFQKGDVVMIVATSGQSEGQTTVITLLGGVEPILQATTGSQAASILSPWSLNQGGAGDMGTP